MKLGLRLVLIGVAAVLGLGCTAASPPVSASNDAKSSEVTVDDALVQFSLLSTLAAGDYGDGAPLGNVLSSGDFGVGTFNRLDGEMIVLEGKIYQAFADGRISPADLSGTTPFAAVTFFNEEGRIENVAAKTLSDLDEQLDRKLPHLNAPYAIRIDGEFPEISLRSVPAQSPPFQPLVEVVKQQVTWRHQNLRGVLVGLRCPAWIGTLNVSGYHWHFLSEDRKIGGHVLACELRSGLLRFDECTSVVIHLPESSKFHEFQANDINEKDIDQIERQRSPAGTP